MMNKLIFLCALFEIVWGDSDADGGWSLERVFNRGDNAWQGRWFPQPPGKAMDDNPTAELKSKNHDTLYDSVHGVRMGVSSIYCDNANVNLTVDWDFSPINYTCFENRRLYEPRLDVNPVYIRDYIPPQYSAIHKCMDTPIFYDEDVPSYGTHRPLWPKYGEYLFLPRQRWLHSLEHGAVVMLYHPCANKMEVMALKELVRTCLYRHIITPYTLLTQERPFALVTWGHKLFMSVVDPKVVINFIQTTALRGAEKTSRDGQYDMYLLDHAEVVTDVDDQELCPFFKSKLMQRK